MRDHQNAGSPWMVVAVRPAGRRVVVVGSGAVARRRVEQFALRGARVEIFDPHLDETARQELPPDVVAYAREITPVDVAGAWLVIVATSDPAVNDQVGLWAAEHDIACNRTDDADAGTLAVPALLEDDLGWKVAVLGGQAGPLFSAWVKGLVGQMAATQHIADVYSALAAARLAVDDMPLPQRERAFLLRKAMACILEQVQEQNGTTEAIDGAALITDLYQNRSR